jgi:sugar-specific transcriptional regulator TrmB
MVRKALEIIEFSQKEILLVTRFQNELIINAVMQKAKFGVSVKILVDTNLVESYFEQEKETRSDKNNNERNDVVSNPFYPLKIERRYIKAPFSFIIVDSKHLGLEIVDVSEPKKFKLSIYLDDKSISSSITDVFNNLWQKSSINPPKIITKSIQN